MAEQNEQSKGRVYSSILIEPFRQIKFGIYIIGISIAFIGIASWLFIDSFVAQYNHVMELFNVVDPELRREFILDAVFYENLIRLVIFFSIYLVVTFITVFKLTHRYYGPLVSIERFIEKLKEGDFSSRVSIRKKDELQNLVKKLNSLAEYLQDKEKK